MRVLGRAFLFTLAVLFALLFIVEIKRLVVGHVKVDVGVIVLAMTGSATALCVYGASRLGVREPASAQVIRAAETHGGRVTAAQVVAATRLSWDDANGELDRLCKAGACELIAGTTTYRFAEFERKS
jgi:hypothetical protein